MKKQDLCPEIGTNLEINTDMWTFNDVLSIEFSSSQFGTIITSFEIVTVEDNYDIVQSRKKLTFVLRDDAGKEIIDEFSTDTLIVWANGVIYPIRDNEEFHDIHWELMQMCEKVTYSCKWTIG